MIFLGRLQALFFDLHLQKPQIQQIQINKSKSTQLHAVCFGPNLQLELHPKLSEEHASPAKAQLLVAILIQHDANNVYATTRLMCPLGCSARLDVKMAQSIGDTLSCVSSAIINCEISKKEAREAKTVLLTCHQANPKHLCYPAVFHAVTWLSV